jgi:GNAT superfamily N-acetyltransferase
MSSNANTPMLEPLSSQTLPPPSPAPLARDDDARSNPVPSDLPPLTVSVLREEDDKIDAINLVTDSIAQQRQVASFNMVFHPFLLAILVCCEAAGFQYSWRMQRDQGMAMLLMSGIAMTYLLAIRYFSGRYIHIAEGMRWSWFENADGDEDTFVGVRFGKLLIGTLVLRLEANPTLAGKKRGRQAAMKGGKGVIRAWTVLLKYRRKGVGTDLLHEAVRITREKCGKEAEVGFAREHANSTMVVPEIFNGQFRKLEMKAAKALDGVLGEWEGTRRRR